MKRTLMHTMTLILLLSLCLSLAACATEKSAVGTWEGNWSYDGADIYIILSISEDGTYSKTSYRNGLYRGGESGTWELDGNELKMHETGELGVVIYDFNGKTMINNGHKLKKQ